MTTFRIWALFLLVLALSIGGSMYIARYFWDLFQARYMRIRYVLVIWLFFWCIFAVMLLANSTSIVWHILYQISAVAMWVYMFLVIYTLLIHGASFFVALSSIAKIFIPIVLTAITCMYGTRWSYQIHVVEQEIAIPWLGKEIKAIHLTDTHLGHFRWPKNLEKIVTLINAIDADVIFFTGDFLDAKIQHASENYDILATINKPIYFIDWNHDIHVGVQWIKDELRKRWITVLENEVTMWEWIQIVWLNHMVADEHTVDMHAEDNGKDTIKSVLAWLPIKKDIPTILLHHSPDGAQYAQQAGVDLYLAGHTHAGQMFPATLIAKRIFPYNHGFYKLEDMSIYTCSWTGTFFAPMRIGTDSELCVLSLVAQ